MKKIKYVFIFCFLLISFTKIVNSQNDIDDVSVGKNWNITRDLNLIKIYENPAGQNPNTFHIPISSITGIEKLNSGNGDAIVIFGPFFEKHKEILFKSTDERNKAYDLLLQFLNEEIQWQEYKLHYNYIEFYRKNPQGTAEESSFVRISEIIEVRYHIEGGLTHIYIFTSNTNHTLHKGESDFKMIMDHFKYVK